MSLIDKLVKPKDKVLYQVNSSISGVVKVIETEYGRELNINNTCHSVQSTKKQHPGYWGYVVKATKIEPGSTILMLGLGGGEIVRLINNQCSDCKIVAIELDPVIVDIYKRYFSPPDNLDIVLADAYDYVLNSSNNYYDIVISDAFKNEEFVRDLLSDTFVEKVSEILKENGQYLTNIIFNSFVPEKCAEYKAILKRYFKNVEYKSTKGIYFGNFVFRAT